MKNNKGFTLVELLGVIVVLALIITIAIPSTMSISNRLKKNMFCSKIDFIENAAKLYGEDRKDSFTANFNISGINYKSENIQVNKLVNLNYLKKDKESAPFIEDPRDKSKGLDNEELTVYIKNNRIYVNFSDEINTTCHK